MKKQFIPLLLLVFFAGFACSKTADQAETANADSGGTSEVYIESDAAPEGVVLLDGSLNELKDDGKMHWKAGINAGDTVGWTGEKTEAVRAYDGEKRTFYRVLSNGDYWIQDYFIYGPAEPAVITGDETVLYTKPDPSAVARTGTVTLPKYTLVAMRPDDDLTDDFIPIAAALGGAKPDERWVRIKDISWDSNDVGGVKLARVAAATKNSAAHKELLKNAMEMILKGSRFYDVPDNVRNDPALFELEITNNLEFNIPEIYFVTQDSVNLRDLPTVNGNIVGKIAIFDSVTINAKSKKQEKLEVNGEKFEGVWCRTEDGNWVFSSFISNQGMPPG